MSDLTEFLAKFAQDDNEWRRTPQGDLLNLFEDLLLDRDGWQQAAETYEASRDAQDLRVQDLMDEISLLREVIPTNSLVLLDRAQKYEREVDRLMRVEVERDEARAEVERLRQLLALARTSIEQTRMDTPEDEALRARVLTALDVGVES